MHLRNLAASIATVIALLFAQTAYSASGDVITSFPINNVLSDGRTPSSPHGVTFHDGYAWVVDFGTDRIYRVYPEDVYDEDEVTLLFSAGDSDLNIPITDNLPSPIPFCGADGGTQICGGGGLTFAENFLWNASPVTDDIIKIDPLDGDNLETENALASLAFPAPTDITHDGTNFWISDWQSNVITQVRPEDGATLSTIDGPNPTSEIYGLTWDGQALWVADRADNIIYRVSHTDGTILNFFNAPGTNPRGLSWDGESLWHVDASDGLIYRIDSGVIPYGITGCVEKNGTAINSEVLLEQLNETPQVTNTDIDGCFHFSSFVSGVDIKVGLDENGVNAKPVITLNEATPGITDITLIVGDTYSEPGFTVTDFEDGTIDTADVVAVPNVLSQPTIIDTSAPNPTGTLVKYDVIDSAGNAADSAYRTVYVLEVDTTPPVITLIGDNPTYVEQGSAYTELGSTATDDRDGDITGDIVITSTVNTNSAGTYSVFYDVTDATGNNATTATRSVIIQDTTAPVITLAGADPLILQKGATFTEPGATATDNIDGTIALNDTNMSGGVASDNVGSYIRTYNYSDVGGNAAVTVTRVVNVIDTAAPVITMLGSSPLYHEINTAYSDPGATAIDPPSENLSLDIVVSSTVNIAALGNYTVTYNVSDEDGNAATPIIRQVIISDTGAPSLSLNGNQTVNLQKGDTYNELGATATDAVDNDATLTASIVISGSVDTATIGTYILSYDVSDSALNAAVTVTRTINVSDTGAPVITLNGNQTINLQKGDTYNELGATATDAVDDDATLTTSIVISGGPVDTASIGTYILSYDVSDSALNAAVTVTRTINVSDTGAPIITLIGNSSMTIEQGSTFNDPGAQATDAVDDNTELTNNISVTGTVDINTLGSYTLSYNVSDSALNAAATVTRTVQVVTAADTTPPVITLNGLSSISIEQYSTYNDLGAQATDNIDNNTTITSRISVSGIVNTGIVGTYTLNYNVSDDAGNAATTITRSVQVTQAADSTPPVIVLLGNNTVTIAQNATYTDSGVSLSDNIDNTATLTANLTIVNSVDTSIVGSYTVTFDTSDSAGNNATTVTRTVNVTATPDTTPPVISLIGNSNITIEQNTEYNEQGAQATDNIDNTAEITSRIVISSSVNNTTVGIYTLNYDVFDNAGNAAPTVSRTIQVVAAADTTPPTITLSGDNPLELTVGGTFNEPGYSANDDVDGTITGSVTVNTSAINTNIIGSYSVTYTVSDNASNSVTVTRTVNVSAAPDTTPPTITLLGNNPLEVTVGGSYNEPGYTATDNVDGTITGSVMMNTSAVNTNTVGSYPVTYNVSDNAGNAATTVTRTINVTAAPDITPPVITLVGGNPVEITVGGIYNEQGASATDNVDGDISGSITINSSAVNTNAIGSYSVSYDVSDTANNNATTAMRTVNVVAIPDTTPPTITLLGDNPQEIVLGGTYVEQGANASDNVDVINSGSIAINSSAINTGIIGSYTVTYNVSDTAGNNATTITRTVNVVSATTTYSASPALAVGAASISTTLNIADNKQIADLNIFIDMPHAYPGDVSIILTSPSGTSVTIIDGPGIPASQYGCSNDDFLVTLDDEGTGNAEDTCTSPPALSGTLIPNSALSAFDGESSQGTWTLRLDDSYTGSDTGTLNSWSLVITQ